MGLGQRKISLMVLLSTGIVLGLAIIQTSNAQDTPQDYLDAHNSARDEYCIDELRSDDKLASYAEQYASKHINDCNLVHSGGPYGENLAWSGGELSGVDAVKMWVNEKVNYDENSNTCALGKVCGHYTQVVWRNSVRLGCAKVRCNGNKGTFIGCNYDPPGNYIGQRPF
ncbi:Cysteine-rich secretory protein, allergen V5/Tpx-1-related [Trema orientale]|uniref:Cysteine-rich secretory protein, allergen V5/Tpx-1-related n=1 Tax=Trema orientale TaxID=63057 RepID=A0A2P5EMM6_TREOI|nr:Cysteine-rich secretory protein, allergen V5/Tpx-1-related [Trema orientale]